MEATPDEREMKCHESEVLTLGPNESHEKLKSVGRTMSDAIADFRDAMRANGVPYAGDIIADGKLHRCYVEGDRRGSKNGWYLLHLDGRPAGAFGSMRNGNGKTTWTAKGAKPMTREEREALREEMEGNRARRAAALAIERANAAVKAEVIWESANDAGDHPYLQRKQVKAHGLKTGTWVRDYGMDSETGEVQQHRIANALLVPIRNSKKIIVSLQAIFPDDKNPLKRDKDYLHGGEKRGCYFAIGKPGQVDGQKVVCLAEGYATGASIHEATGLGVVVVFDAANLLPVAETYRRLMPDALILFAADNDAWTKVGGKPSNVGIMKAIEAAATVSGKVVFPRFKNTASKPTDFNDLQALEGADEVRRQIMGGFAVAPEVEPELRDGPNIPEPPPHTEIPPAREPYDMETPPAAWVAPAPKVEDESGGDDSLVDSSAYFKIVGHDREKIYVYQREKKMVVSRGEANWDKSALIALAPLQWWEMNFRGDRGLNKDMAHNWLVRTAYRRGFYDPTMTRGRGAWMDEERIVYHFGNSLWVDGEDMSVDEIKSRYAYEQGKRLPHPHKTAMTAEEGRAIYELATKFRWSRPASAVLLAGWVALAPICGALRWRPHIWITGGAGSGKSTILNGFVHFLMNGAVLYAQGNSTEAGIRQTFKNDAIPLIFDESEQNNEREVNRMQAVLAFMRQSSTESEARTYKGTAHGNAMEFQPRPMVCLSSIQVGIKHVADYERISILALRPKRETEDAASEWKDLSRRLGGLRADRDFPARLLRRSLNLLPLTLKNVETFAAAAATKFGTQREGDQYGALLAGAWSLVSDRLATVEEATRMIERYDWSEYLENSETEDCRKALDAVMGAMVPVGGGNKVTVHELVRCAVEMGVDAVDIGTKEAAAILKRHGIAIRHGGVKPADATVVISYAPVELLKLLTGTPYSADLKGQLLRIPGTWRYDKTVSFNSSNSRCVAIPMSLFMDDEDTDSGPLDDDSVPF